MEKAALMRCGPKWASYELEEHYPSDYKRIEQSHKVHNPKVNGLSITLQGRSRVDTWILVVRIEERYLTLPSPFANC